MAATAITQNIVEGVSRRAEYLRSLTDPSRGELKSPTFRLDVTEALRACVLLRDYLFETFNILWKDAADNEVDDYDFAGRMALLCLSMTQATFRAVWDRAEEVRGAAPPDVSPPMTKARADFDQAMKDVEALGQDFKSRWPWFDESKLERSVAEERQGVRRRSLKEVHDDLRRRVR